jgi:hypothetical protein
MKLLTVTNTLAYYETELTTATDIFNAQVPIVSISLPRHYSLCGRYYQTIMIVNDDRK